VGITGTTWAYQQLGLEPDIVAFAKKVQLGGIMAGRRVDQVPDNVLRVSGRIHSTWGGGLVDMVRARRIMEIIERDDLVAHAAAVGSWFLAELRDLEARHAAVASNARGRGLMSAVDLPDSGVRDEAVRRLRTEEQVIALPCGERSVRFRPALSITQDELAVALRALDRVLAGLH
jgi:L-lysine 6-transaminase